MVHEFFVFSAPKSNYGILDDHAFRWASCNGHTECVSILLADKRINPRAVNSEAFRDACDKNHIDVLEMLLKDGRIDPTASGNDAMIRAAQSGSARAIQVLLQDGRADPTVDSNHPICSASERGHVEVVRLLINDPRVNPGDFSQYAIGVASEHGHSDIVELLLSDSRVDPSANENYAIRMAIKGKHSGVQALLLPDPRVIKSFISQEFLASLSKGTMRLWQQNYHASLAARVRARDQIQFHQATPRKSSKKLENIFSVDVESDSKDSHRSESSVTKRKPKQSTTPLAKRTKANSLFAGNVNFSNLFGDVVNDKE